jgi:hypothetical protein
MNKDESKDINLAETVKNLKKIYKKTTFFTSYGTSIFLFIFITLLFFLFFSYYNVMNNIHKYREDPSKYRCHPTVMPFAAYIYPHPGMTNTEFNRSNFRYCTREILKDVLSVVLLPLEYIANIISQIQFQNFNFLNALRSIFSEIRNVLNNIFNLLYSLLINFFASLNHIIVYISDAIYKSTGIIMIGTYITNAVVYCIRVIANITMWGIIYLLIGLGILMIMVFVATYCVVFFVTEAIPFFGWAIAPVVAWAIAIAVSLIYLVTYIIISVIFGKVANEINKGLNITAPIAPQRPTFTIPRISGRRKR